MQWLVIILALVFAIPTYGISIVILLILLPILGAKTRREVFPPLISHAFYTGEWISTDNVYFESAVKYAEENGGKVNPATGSASFYTLVDNVKVHVIFAKAFDGSLEISAKSNDSIVADILSDV